jgi:Family of unknown function (DUF6519)
MMTGDYTKVPLRPDERWTGARMQEGRVLLDHEWNLNLDAAARAARAAAADVIGPSGVVAGSDDFKVGVTATDLTVHAGRIWVDGLLALAPADFTYSSQDQIAALPGGGSGGGKAIVFLEAFEEHVQPAEDTDALVDPALASVDSAARTRVGYRVRAASTTGVTCKDAFDALTTVPGSTGNVSISRVAPTTPADPCAPPGDPLGQLPEGLFRVEVIDPGTQATARFAWSFENGAAAVAVAAVAGDEVTLAPSAGIKFANGDLVEVSWLARRADRVPHGELYTISQPPEAGAGGDVLSLNKAVTAPAGADGLVVRRWHGQAVGAAAARIASLRGSDLGVRFTAANGSYSVGDWWGARLREGKAPGLEVRTNASPDGIRRAFAPLALVDLDARSLVSDCRLTFVPLTKLELGAGSCTVTAQPGDDLQAAVDKLPPEGGELCLAAGVYPLAAPVLLNSRKRIVATGAGSATVIRALQSEAAIVIQASAGIELRQLRIEGGTPGGAGDPQLNAAVTVIGSKEVSIADCAVACPESAAGRSQTCITARSGAGGDPDGIRVERNRLEVGAWETGILLIDVGHAVVAGNEVALAPDVEGKGTLKGGNELVIRTLRSLIAAAVRPTPQPGTKQVAVPGAEPLNVLVGSDAEKLIDALAPQVSTSLGASRGALKAVQAVARNVTTTAFLDALSKAAQAVVGKVRQELLVAGQGIVVGGSHAGTIEILDNTVKDAVQGIHVGVSSPAQGGREAAEEVIIARNVVHSLVPRAYDRDRYAVFVGNVRSLHVVDTVATLRRLAKIKVPPTPVEGIRIHGELGPFVTVRQTSLRNFTVGVRVVPLGTAPVQRVWLVAETMAVGSTSALDAPATIDRERNVP